MLRTDKYDVMTRNESSSLLAFATVGVVTTIFLIGGVVNDGVKKVKDIIKEYRDWKTNRGKPN